MTKAVFGAAIWIASALAAVAVLGRLPDGTRGRLHDARVEFLSHWMEREILGTVSLPIDTPLRLADGVFRLDAQDLVRIGEVVRMEAGADGRLSVGFRLDPALVREPLRKGSSITARTQGRSLVHCVRWMLPPDRLERIQEEWRAFLVGNQRELVADLAALAPRLLDDATEFLRAELPLALRARRADLERLTEHYRVEISEERLVPLLSKTVWPIVAQHGVPVAETIGRELWDAAPLFDLAWRAAWDRIVSDGPVKLERRWRDFLSEEAVPTVERHENEIRTALRAILEEVARSAPVREQFRDVGVELAEDPRAREIVLHVLEDVFLHNPRFLDFLERHATDPTLLAQLGSINARMQKFFDKVSWRVVYTDDGETINPGLVKVLRTVLLKRDRGFLFLEPGDGPVLEEGEILVGNTEY